MSKERSFYIKYVKTAGDLKAEDLWHVRTHGPVDALNAFHIYQQQIMERAPEAYEITRLFIEYKPEPMVEPQLTPDEWRKTWIQSDFDLPQSPNPDVRVKPAEDLPVAKTETFGFFDETPVRNKAPRPRKKVEKTKERNDSIPA